MERHDLWFTKNYNHISTKGLKKYQKLQMFSLELFRNITKVHCYNVSESAQKPRYVSCTLKNIGPYKNVFKVE